MKDLIIGFEFEGTLYGAYLVFSIMEDLGAVVAECAELRSFSQPEPLVGQEKNHLLERAEKVMVPMIQAHIMKEYNK